MVSGTKSTSISIEEQKLSESKYKLKIWNSSVNFLVHILIGIVVGVTVILVYTFGVPLTWGMLHMLLCVIGYQLLMAEAILSLSPDNTWSSFMKLRDKKRAHWILQVVGSVLAIIGTVMEFLEKSVHFESLHGIFGIVAFIFTVLSLINGLTSQYAYEFRQFLPPKLSKVTHILFGVIAFVTSSISLCYGFDMEWFREWLVVGQLAEVLIVFTAIFTFVIVINPFVTLFVKYLNIR